MSCTRLFNFTLAMMLTACHAAFADELPSPPDFLNDWAAAWQTGDADRMMSFYDSSEET